MKTKDINDIEVSFEEIKPPKEMYLTDEEKETVPKYLAAIATVLAQKLSEGIPSPSISGNMEVEGDKNLQIIFSIKAKEI